MAERGLASAVGDAATAASSRGGARAERLLGVRSNLQTRPASAADRELVERRRRLLEQVEAAERRVRQLLEERVR